MNGGPTVNVVTLTPVSQTQLAQAGMTDGDNTMVSSWGNLMVEKLVTDQLGNSYQIDETVNVNAGQQIPGPTGANPSMDSYLGDYGFVVKMHRLSDNIKNKSWDVSELGNFS